MKAFRFLALAAIALAWMSCGPTRYTSAGVNLAAIDEYAFIEPLAYVTYYARMNQGSYDADLSRRAAATVEGVISSQRYPFSDVIEVNYDRENSLRKWVENLANVDAERAESVRVPNKLEKLIADSGHRYGVVIYTLGFIQSAEAREYERMQKSIRRAMDKVVEKITEKKVYSTDTYMSSPYGNAFYCAVIDSETGRIVHYSHVDPFFSSSPTDGSEVSYQLRELLKDIVR